MFRENLKDSKSTKVPERIFLFCSLFFGVALILLTPPFQVPDEYNHFYRLYQISEGIFIPIKKDNRVGGYVPGALTGLADTTRRIPFNPEAKMDLDKLRLAWRITSSGEERVFVDFNNTALMSFIPYLHQSIAVWAIRKLSNRVILYAHAARLANLLLWAALIYGAIRLAPGIEWLIVAVALMPTGFHLAASMSYDAFTISSCIYFVALMHGISVSKMNRLQIGSMIVVGVFAFMLAMAKFAYLPLVALFVFLPERYFGSRMKKYAAMLAVSFPALVAWSAWTVAASELYVSYDDYDLAYRARSALIPGVDPGRQILFMLSDPVLAAKILLSAFANKLVYETMIARTGWLDTVYPEWFLNVWLCGLLLVCLRPGVKVVQLPLAVRVGMAIMAVLCIMFFAALLYVQWSPVGNRSVHQLQGRYLIPVLLPALISVALPRGNSRFMGMLVDCWSALFYVFSCIVVLSVVWARYYSNV